jgi:hypothetical protein
MIMGNTETDTSSDGKDSKKSFTIRIEEDIIKQLTVVGETLGIKPATVARNYLKLADYFVVLTNGEIKGLENSRLMVFPFELYEYMRTFMNEDQQTEMGDRLGSKINECCDIAKIEEPMKKIRFAEGLGWFRLQEVKGYLGIPMSFASERMVDAMMFRVVSRRRISGDYYLNPDPKEKKEFQAAQGRLNAARAVIGSAKPIPDAKHFFYEVLKVPAPAEPPKK